MKQQQKLSSNQQHTEQTGEQQEQRQEAHEFASAEEVLRFDAQQTPVPPEVEARLKQSTARETPPPASTKPWWKSLFGR
jgi:hypothetical protein